MTESAVRPQRESTQSVTGVFRLAALLRPGGGDAKARLRSARLGLARHLATNCGTVVGRRVWWVGAEAVCGWWVREDACLVGVGGQRVCGRC